MNFPYVSSFDFFLNCSLHAENQVDHHPSCMATSIYLFGLFAGYFDNGKSTPTPSIQNESTPKHTQNLNPNFQGGMRKTKDGHLFPETQG